MKGEAFLSLRDTPLSVGPLGPPGCNLVLCECVWLPPTDNVYLLWLHTPGSPPPCKLFPHFGECSWMEKNPQLLTLPLCVTVIEFQRLLRKQKAEPPATVAATPLIPGQNWEFSRIRINVCDSRISSSSFSPRRTFDSPISLLKPDQRTVQWLLLQLQPQDGWLPLVCLHKMASSVTAECITEMLWVWFLIHNSAEQFSTSIIKHQKEKITVFV